MLKLEELLLPPLLHPLRQKLCKQHYAHLRTPCAIDSWHTSLFDKMARQSTALLAALLLPAAQAIRPSGIARREAIKAAPPAFLLASRPAWARYDDYKDGPRGLKYVVTEPGAGATPQRGQSVKAEYTLTLDGFAEDGGRVVDSSKGFMKGPFAFYAGTGGVIKGWDLMIMEMKEGEARKLIIPADLGYGSKGAGGKIPGGATLYFEVKLAALGDAPVLNEKKQQQWLDEHPI